MILQALMKLTEQENLLENPAFELKRVSWFVVLNKDGTFIDLADNRIDLNADNKRKAMYVGRWVQVPRQSTRTSGDKAFFLVDKSEYIFGLDPTEKQTDEKLDKRFTLFKQIVASCVQQTEDAGAKAVLAFLDALTTNKSSVKSHPNFVDVQPNDLIGFKVDRKWVHQADASAEFWASTRSPETESDKPKVTYTCLVTGEQVVDIPLFPLLKKVPGGTSSGVSLVSHNASAFLSYGLKGNENAPISRRAAESCGVALTRLLDPDYRSPSNPDEALPPRQVRLSSNTVVCYWAREQTQETEGILSALPSLLSGETEEDVGEAYRSIWSGNPVEIENPNDFYALTLSGTQGRAIVRDWLETSLQNVCDNLTLHFSDLQICRNTHPKKGSSWSPAVPMYWLLKSLVAEGKSESIPPSIESGFVRSAINGTLYPLQILQRALVRGRAECGDDDWTSSMRRDARAALIKAVLNRRRRHSTLSDPEAVTYPEVEKEMNPNLESPGYSCGMLIAILERLQALAIGDVNASLVDRYFAAASASPRSVFVRLLKNSMNHYRKVRDDSDKQVAGSARYLERLKDQIISRFEVGESTSKRIYPRSASGFPLHLNLEQQGLFMLGYHQMRHWLWMKKEDRAAWESDHPDAPSVFLRKKADEVETNDQPTE
jgi:CRISPR-associated protein Csd1